jgi:glycosyltransferase involved in cell wall biosynthesis
MRRLLTALPSVLMHPRDAAAPGFSLWADLKLVRALRRRAGFLIATRPGYNLIAADLSPPGLVTIGQEHMHLRHHPRELRREMRRWYGRLDALTVLTERDRLAYEGLLDGRVRVVRIPNSVRRLEGAHADLTAKVVLAAGRLSRQKGYDLLIRAFAAVATRHAEWRLRICGEGPRRLELERLIRELGLEERIALEPPARDLGAEMAGASIFALSSRFEGLPLTLLEAMSKGMAIVSFDCPTGPADVIENRRNGLLVPPGDVDAFATGVRELIEDENLRGRCAAAAVETSRRYAIEAIGPQWEGLFRDLHEAQQR